MEKITSFDEYMVMFSPEIQERLTSVRNLIRELIPDAEEVISYQMPAFKYKKKILVYFAAFKNHIGFYATPSANEAFIKELSHYKSGKGSIQFPNNQPLPLDLISKLTLYKASLIEMKEK